MTETATLPLPAAVLARLRTADSLRAELAATVAERDALREQVDATAWERETAQTEASYLANEVLGRGPFVSEGTPVGTILTSGDEPPPPPENGPDYGFVSLSSGQVWVRPYPQRDAASFARYRGGMGYDWPMCEHGPFVVVDGFASRDHLAILEAERNLSRTIYSAGVGLAKWPDSTADIRETITKLSSGPRDRDPSEWIDRWHRLAGATRAEWEAARGRAEYLTEILRRTPHEGEWLFLSGVRTCNVCLVAEAEHLPIPEAATP